MTLGIVPLFVCAAFQTASLALPKGAPVETAAFLGADGRSGKHDVRARLTWREDALEIRLRRTLEPGESPKAVGTADNPVTIFRDDVDTLEVFLAPHADDPGTLYQFAVNPSNVLYQAKGLDASWRPAKPVVVTATCAADAWYADFRIPFGAFGEKPVGTGTVWRANFSGRHMNWSALSFYHNPFDYGTLVFGGTFARIDPVPQVGPPKDATVLELDRFYYPAGTDPAAAARERYPQAAVQVARLSETEYALTIEQDGCRSVSQIEVGSPTDVRREPSYMVKGSTDTGSRFQVGSFLKGFGYVQSPARGYLFDASVPFFCDTNRLARQKANPHFFNRFAYEAQMAVMTRVGKTGPITVEPSSAAFYRARYAELKPLFPQLLFSLHVDCSPRVVEFAPACDILDVTFPGCSFAVDPLPRLKSAFDYLRCHLGDKPLVLWLGGSLPAKGAHRTADELNTAVRYSILRGAVGNMIHLGHGSVPKERTRLWDFLRGVEQATNAWYPDWATGVPLDLEIAADDGVAAAAREKDGLVLLLATNLTPAERTLAFRDPRTGTRQTVRLPAFGSVLRRGAK